MLDALTIALCPKLRCCNYVSNSNETPTVSKLLLNLNLFEFEETVVQQWP